MAKILRVNMADLSITEETPQAKYARIGGRARMGIGRAVH